MKMGKVICCLYVMPKTISYFPWGLEGVKDFHTDFSCPNSKDILNLFLIFSSFPQGSVASLLWVLSAVLMRVSISIGKLHSAALSATGTALAWIPTAWNLHLSDLTTSTWQQPPNLGWTLNAFGWEQLCISMAGFVSLPVNWISFAIMYDLTAIANLKPQHTQACLMSTE